MQFGYFRKRSKIKLRPFQHLLPTTFLFFFFAYSAKLQEYDKLVDYRVPVATEGLPLPDDAFLFPIYVGQPYSKGCSFEPKIQLGDHILPTERSEILIEDYLTGYCGPAQRDRLVCLYADKRIKMEVIDRIKAHLMAVDHLRIAYMVMPDDAVK